MRARPTGWPVISRTGSSSWCPRPIHASEPLQLELILPDEITQRGEMRIKLAARPLRQEIVGDGLREETRGVRRWLPALEAFSNAVLSSRFPSISRSR